MTDIFPWIDDVFQYQNNEFFPDTLLVKLSGNIELKRSLNHNEGLIEPFVDNEDNSDSIVWIDVRRLTYVLINKKIKETNTYIGSFI